MTNENSAMGTEQPLHIAAIVIDTPSGADHLLLEFSMHLKKSGWQVRGLIQQKQLATSGCQVWLRDVSNDNLYPISQHLGSLSTSCQIDTSGMVEAGIALRRITEDNTDLAIFNRFSGLEAQGQGFAQEMLSLMSLGIPVITIVPERHLAAWRHFTGGMASELKADRQALERWFSEQHTDSSR